MMIKSRELSLRTALLQVPCLLDRKILIFRGTVSFFFLQLPSVSGKMYSNFDMETIFFRHQRLEES
jgi:hypothetical protein